MEMCSKNKNELWLRQFGDTDSNSNIVCMLVFSQTVDDVLGSWIRGGYFKHICYAQKCFICFLIWYNLVGIETIN